MAVVKVEIRKGAYYDSVVLMELQASLKKLPGILNVGAMMGSASNKEILEQNGLLTQEAKNALPDDLIISIEGKDTPSVDNAMVEIEKLISQRRTISEEDYIPKSIQAAAALLPNALWVLVSVPGQYAPGVAREALQLKKNVFLYSDNVSLKEEILLKREFSEHALLLMGPDCGTAIINGVGFGFANKIRKGPIGLVGASGTGLQQVTSRIHQMGSGITHAIGTGGRDLSKEIDGITTHQGLGLLKNDPETKVIVLISKPPSTIVASKLIQNAKNVSKPVIINFIGYSSPGMGEHFDNLHFTSSLDDTAELAINLANSSDKPNISKKEQSEMELAKKLYLRGIFSGGTLAYESLLLLQNHLPVIYSNIAFEEEYQLKNSWKSQHHTIIDLGEDEFTQGRPHPMIDNSLRIERLIQEGKNPEVGVIIMDIVLGFGAHPDPAAELSPVISNILNDAKNTGRDLEIIVILVGTDEDPQNLESQMEQLKKSGARVETRCKEAIGYIISRFQNYVRRNKVPNIDVSILKRPVEVINVGLESFAASIIQQQAKVIHVDWRPPAGGNEKLMSILERMKNK